MKVDTSITVKLSLREARALLRAVSAVGRLTYDTGAKGGFESQPEMWRLMSNIESSVGSALADLTYTLWSNYGPGFTARHRWSDEPITAPLPVVRKAVA